MQNHAIKRYSFLFLAFFWLFSFSTEAAAQLSGVCPLPAELKIKINGTAYSFNETAVVDEDTPMTVEFIVVPFAGTTANKDNGTEIPVASLTPGSFDSSTTNAEDWQPDHLHATYQHICTRPSPVDKSCWTPKGGMEDRGASHDWGSVNGWKIKETQFSYTTDDFDLGNNADETDRKSVV